MSRLLLYRSILAYLRTTVPVYNSANYSRTLRYDGVAAYDRIGRKRTFQIRKNLCKKCVLLTRVELCVKAPSAEVGL